MKCPSCASIVLVEGQLNGKREAGSGETFVPKDLRALALTFGVELEQPRKLFACTQCGLVWNRVDADELVQLLVDEGKEAVRRRLKRHKPK